MGGGFPLPPNSRRELDMLNKSLENELRIVEETGERGEILRQAFYISWEESERGWGTRPDGYSLHLSKEDYLEFVKNDREEDKKYWRERGMSENYVPDEYSRPAGSLVEVLVSEPIYKEVRENENGVRRYDERVLVENGDLIFISERDGWVPLYKK